MNPDFLFPLAWVVSCSVLLAACAPVRPRDEAPPPAPAAAPSAPSPAVSAPAPAPPAAASAALPSAAQATLAALQFADQVRAQSGADLARQMVRLNELLPEPQATIELALLLGQTRSNGDTARALAVLDPLLRSTAADAAPWQPLARLLAARYTEQRRLEDQIERLNQQARENQRRVDQLNEKLEALKAIERSLTTTRPAAPAASAPRAKAP